MATTISVIGLLLAAVIFVIIVWKGVDVFTSTILVSFIIILTSRLDWWVECVRFLCQGICGVCRGKSFCSGDRRRVW